ncbi:DNA adenine methylase [Paenibacillaceae bacterium WGS1546]|uniref:DNA adenine methylase n=1 Tax=Cohnella sp. WGS1546 TaxID=3366810 RepID=UPI00372D7D7A
MQTLKAKKREVYPEKGHRASLIPYVGGKSQLIGTVLPIIEYAIEHYNLEEYWEICGGGARFLLNLPPSRLSKRVYNEIDKSLCALFYCLTKPELTYELIEVLERQGVGEDVFLRAKKLKETGKVGDEDYDLVTAAACAFIVAMQSRAAMQTVFSPSILTPSSRKNYMNRVRTLDRFLTTTKDIVVMNEDVLQLLSQSRDWSKSFLYIDPPYTPDQMRQDDHYSVNWSNADHERLVDLLLENRQQATIALSGYDNPVYQRLVEDGSWRKLFLKTVHVSSSVTGRYQEEFLWINFPIPLALEEQVCEFRIKD